MVESARLKHPLQKPKVFIASTLEGVDVARAVQQNLRSTFETKVWDQDTIKISTYPIESLTAELDSSHFGIFIVTPDDFVVSRDKAHRAPRDNVIFELGMFVGRLGIRRSYIVIPDNVLGKLKLPSDLQALTLAPYEAIRGDRDLVAATGPACTQIRNAVKGFGHNAWQHPALAKAIRPFSELQSDFIRLIDTAQTIRLYFIHSRRWRENNNDQLNNFLSRSNTKLTVYLPDVTENILMSSLMPHFDDGRHIPGFIADAYRYFINCKKAFKKKVEIRTFRLYPTYSFYEFDDRIVFALYPLSDLRQDVPAAIVTKYEPLYSFFLNDIFRLKKSTKILSIEKAERSIRNLTPKKRHTRF